MVSWSDGTFTGDDWSVWQQGHSAALDGCQECPYPDGSRESEVWWDGFGEGTEDLIQWRKT